ncbi:hypothetical protein K3495_g3218 [Podosphaera aphanis]|nr:hypothetical protein K3495_g3218 [Podosphaera aphanis]
MGEVGSNRAEASSSLSPAPGFPRWEQHELDKGFFSSQNPIAISAAFSPEVMSPSRTELSSMIGI